MLAAEKENIAKSIIGKTYSLYGGENYSDNFYNQLCISADEILNLFGKNINELLLLTSDLSRSKLRIKKSEKKDEFISLLMKILRRDFSQWVHRSNIRNWWPKLFTSTSRGQKTQLPIWRAENYSTDSWRNYTEYPTPSSRISFIVFATNGTYGSVRQGASNIPG